jgi:NTE family protein
MSDHQKPVRRAFVFGGGGVLGFAWIVGALTAIQHELGIEPGAGDLVVGTSAGSVIAGLLGCGVDIDTIRRHQLGMPLPEDPAITWNYDVDTGGSLPRRPGLRPGSPRLLWDGIRQPSMVSPVVALAGLLPRGRGSLQPMHHMFESLLARTAGKGSWPARRTWIVATDYSNGRRVVFGRPGDPTANLPEAVCSSCAIPAWYAPVRIDARSYIDGGTASNASVDLVPKDEFDEVYVLAPMAALEPDSPRSPVAMVERRMRRAITKGIAGDVAVLREAGARVMLLTPGRDDLSVMGANLMNPNRRIVVLHTAMRTAAVELRNQQHGARRRVATP